MKNALKVFFSINTSNDLNKYNLSLSDYNVLIDIFRQLKESGEALFIQRSIYDFFAKCEGSKLKLSENNGIYSVSL